MLGPFVYSLLAKSMLGVVTARLTESTEPTLRLRAVVLVARYDLDNLQGSFAELPRSDGTFEEQVLPEWDLHDEYQKARLMAFEYLCMSFVIPLIFVFCSLAVFSILLQTSTRTKISSTALAPLK